jgi:hypothetical protein
MQTVKVVRGHYRVMSTEIDVSGRSFPLTVPYTEDRQGGYIHVLARGHADLPAGNIRIRVSSPDQVVAVNTVSESTEDPAVELLSDQDIIDRLRVRFDQLEAMTRAVRAGAIRAMIVSGPPGVGKSHGIERVLDRYQLVDNLAGTVRHETVRGAISALGLYVKLYQYRAPGSILVFDDCDSVFGDELSLNILKAALDSKARRVIHWNTDSIKLRNEGVPDQFEFAGSVIFVTNLRFDRARGKIRDHLAALESRCHFMDLAIGSKREVLLRIRQIVQDGMLAHYGFSDQVHNSLVEYVQTHADRFRELSLRTVVKLADLAVAFPDQWPQYAENTLMRR